MMMFFSDAQLQLMSSVMRQESAMLSTHVPG